MGILRLEGAWLGTALDEATQLVGDALRVEQLPQGPVAAVEPGVFRAAFPLPVELLDDPGTAWAMQSSAGERIEVEWPDAERPAALAGRPDAAATVAKAATEALLEARAEGERRVREKDAEIERVRGELHDALEVVARADEKIDAAQEASTAVSRRLRQAELHAQEAREALRAVEASAGEPRAELERERGRVAELEAAVAEQEELRRQFEHELEATVAKLGAALEGVRAAEGALVASQAPPTSAADEQELDSLRIEVVAASERVGALEAELGARDAREAAQREAIGTLEDALESTRAELDAARAELDRAPAEPQDDDAARLEAEVAARAEAETARAELDAVRSERDAIRAARDALSDELEGELRARETEAADLRAAVAALESKLESTPATDEDSELARAHGSLAVEVERREVLEAEVTDLRTAVERLEAERDAARASGGDSDAEAALVNERERANGLERLLADRDRGERDLHQRIMELEGDLRVTSSRAQSMEAELANGSDGIRVERSTPIVTVHAADDGAPRRPAVRAGEGNPEDFAARLERANKAIEGLQDRST